MADYWAKVYIEIIDDPKMATMPNRLWRRTIELFLLAKKFNRGGHLPETKQLAWMLRRPTDELDTDLKQIALTGIIQAETTGWFVTHFEKRQAATPDKERKAYQRERDHKDQYYGNDNVTELSRSVTQRTENRLTDNRLTENRLTEAETEEKQSALIDPFPIIQHAIECTTGLMPDGSAIKAINELIAMGAMEEDIKAGYGWLVDNGKQFRYYSQLVGPSRTAIAKRIQGSNGHDREIKPKPSGIVKIVLPDGSTTEANA